METKNKITLNVRVHPKSRKQEITKLDERRYRIDVTSAPLKGEANREVCRLIARFLGVPISKVKIIRGHKSRNKLISVEVD